MSNHQQRLGIIALALVLLTGPGSRADFIDWSYNWNALNGSGPLAQLTTVPGSNSTQPNEVAGMAAAYITYLAPPTAHGAIGPTSQNYALTFTLTDTASQQSGTLTFGGTFSGTISATSAHVKNVFQTPLKGSLILGGNTYSLTFGPFIPPTFPSTAFPGVLVADVSVAPTAQQVPEPSSMFLAAMALPVIALARRRRRRPC
jgi:hypothetical protein